MPSVVNLLGKKRVLVHPQDRWNLGAMKIIDELELPVQITELMPRGRLYVVDPEAIERGAAWLDMTDTSPGAVWEPIEGFDGHPPEGVRP